ncbi:MAG: RluA family pseudouridine synthase [Caldithrix sp.]|nr:RluA family pseudouridine synthase [Caldithrix sp.]
MNNPVKKNITVSVEAENQRLDQFLNARFSGYSRSYFNKLIKNKNVLVDNSSVKSGYRLKTGQSVSIEFPIERLNLQPADIPLDIIYEDDDVLVINKPAGMIVHPGRGTNTNTLVHALLHHTKQLAQSDGDMERPGIVHRLDKNTSGLLVVAKNNYALRQLRRQFEQKTIHRIYQALVWGNFEQDGGTIEGNISRSKREPTKMTVGQKGRQAITHYKVIRDYTYCSLLQIKLETGRTHQIRVHLKHIHHPVVGDGDYNGRESRIKQLPPELQKRGGHLLRLVPHQVLHAKQLIFNHPVSGQSLNFDSSLPEWFQVVVQKLPQLFRLYD